MSPIGIKARLVAPYFTEIPPEIAEKWLNKTIDAKDKSYRGLKKAIKTRKDFKEKIAKPVEQAIASFIDPSFVSRSGHTYDEIKNKTRDSMARAEKDYLQRAKTGYEAGQDKGKVELWRKEYARKWCKFIGPLKGYKKGGVKGLSALAVMALCGDPKLKSFLKERIDTIEGILAPHLNWPIHSDLKRILANQIVHWGKEIITLGYEPQDIKQANQELNQLVSEYCPENIAPFTSDGPSHIDFIIEEEIPNPAKPGEKIKQLGLDIQVSTV